MIYLADANEFSIKMAPATIMLSYYWRICCVFVRMAAETSASSIDCVTLRSNLSNCWRVGLLKQKTKRKIMITFKVFASCVRERN